MKKYKSNRFNYEWTGYKKLGIKEGKEIGLILEYMKKYKINLGLLDEENFLIDNMGEIKNAIKYKNT